MFVHALTDSRPPPWKQQTVLYTVHVWNPEEPPECWRCVLNFTTKPLIVSVVAKHRLGCVRGGSLPLRYCCRATEGNSYCAELITSKRFRARPSPRDFICLGSRRNVITAGGKRRVDAFHQQGQPWTWSQVDFVQSSFVFLR